MRTETDNPATPPPPPSQSPLPLVKSKKHLIVEGMSVNGGEGLKWEKDVEFSET